MAKDKPPKIKGVPNKHLHARTTFLYQAATYLTLQTDAVEKASRRGHGEHAALALQLGSHLHAVSRKGQVRLSTEMKRTICKSCNAILIPGRTSTQVVENESRGGKKPWADVLVIKCDRCGCVKRYPVGATRQQRKGKRDLPKVDASPSEDVAEIDQSTMPVIQIGTDQSPSSR